MSQSRTTKKFIISFFSLLTVAALLFLAYMIFIVKAGPLNTSKENSVAVQGIVTDLYEGGVKDLVVKLNEDSNIYYINRALENGFDLKTIRKELLGKEVTLWYAKHRSGPGGHMTQLKYQDSVYYSEWEMPLTAQK